MTTDPYLDDPFDGLEWIDTPGPDVIADPTGRNPTVRVDHHHLTPEDARRLGAAICKGADVADGKTPHRCPYPAAGCTSPDCDITASRRHQAAHEALFRAVRDVVTYLDGRYETTEGSAPGAYRDASKRLTAVLDAHRARGEKA